LLGKHLWQGTGKQVGASLGQAWGASAFVWGSWAFLLLADLAFVWKYTHNVPFCEDWNLLVPYLTGDEPITLSYLWEQNAEHRYPLLKVVLLTVLKLCNGDFRAPTVFGICALGGVACAMIQVAKRLRGRSSCLDAFFPLALLQWGFLSPSVWAWEHAYLLPTLVASILLLLIISKGMQLTIGTGILAGIGLALLPLCSAVGLLYLPPLALWLGCAAGFSWRSSERGAKRISLVIACGLFTALLLMALYFVGYDKTAAHSYAPSSGDLWSTLKVSLAFSAGSFGGEAASALWPLSGLLMLILLALSVGVLVPAARGRSPHRSQAWGLLFFGAAFGMLALGIGYGRGATPDGTNFGFTYRQLPAPILCWLYFVWLLYGPPALRLSIHGCLFACLSLAAAFNIYTYREQEKERYTALEAFERDLQDGALPYELIARYTSIHQGVAPESELARYMRMLRRAGIGTFRYLKDDPAFAELPLPLRPSELHDVKWVNATVQGTGPDSYVTFALPAPTYVAHIRFCYSAEGSRYLVSGVFKACWKRSGDSDFLDAVPVWPSSPSAPDLATLAVADIIEQVRIFPSPHQGAGTLHIKEIMLLVPKRDGPDPISAP
jgi:hypothetical protein